MITLSSKCIYGLAALIELAMLPEGTSLSIKQIAKTASIPEHYLRQLVASLKRAGMVKITRGNVGGCALSLPASNIIIKDVIEKLDGPFTLQKTNIKDPTLKTYLAERQTKIEAVFEQTLEELVAERRRQAQTIAYNI